ncbi:MAG: type II toxin-antitoxin system PemK/MazF family toxin [Paracoccaceae bacterium]|nr:type II toxin-antitoxin system PemK/MazF family toxin [Paracoccaceae bacterium]
MKNNNDHEPMLNIKRPPKLGEIYWCRFPETIYRKEFGYGGKKHRPVLIFSRKNTLHGTSMVIPLSTAEQTRPKFSVKMKSPIDGQDT